MPDGNPNNWIDRLWGNSHDREAEEQLRRLWLAFQADRKEAWKKLANLMYESKEIQARARAQITASLRQPPDDPDVKELVKELVQDALHQAVDLVMRRRWALPADTSGVFLGYLRTKDDYGRFIWVAEVLRRHWKNQAPPGEREKQLEEQSSP